MRTWALIVGLAAVTFVSRAVFLLPGRRWSLPPTVERVLRYAPAAALVAIIVPDIFRVDGVVTWNAVTPRVMAGLVAIGVAALTRNIILTIVAGMAVLSAAAFLPGWFAP